MPGCVRQNQPGRASDKRPRHAGSIVEDGACPRAVRFVNIGQQNSGRCLGSTTDPQFRRKTTPHRTRMTAQGLRPECASDLARPAVCNTPSPVLPASRVRGSGEAIMTVGALCRDFGRRHILPRRHFAVRPLVHPFPASRSIVAAGTFRSIENRPQPPFSLSGTVSQVAYSRSFYHFAAGELLLALLLRSRPDWSRLYPPRVAFDGASACCSGVPLAAQANQIASRVRREVPTTDDGANGNGIGARLNLLA